MNSNIINVAVNTAIFLRKFDCNEDAQKIENTQRELNHAILELKELKWDHLFAVEDEKRHELTIKQQAVIECYAKLKRALLEVFKETFQVIKEKL